MTSAFAKTKLKSARDAIAKKDFILAENAAAQILEYEPDNYNANVFLGLSSVEIGKNDQAEASYRKAISLAPNQLLAWQGLAKFYDRAERWVDLKGTMRNLIDLYVNNGDTVKCAEAVQRYVDLERIHGTPRELLEALELYLPGSAVYDMLSQLPLPDPTAPTSTPTHQAQTAIENSLPILEEMTLIEETFYAAYVKKEVDQRRTRLGAPPLKVLKAAVESEACSQTKLFKLYSDIINHARTADDLRRSTETKLLLLLHTYLVSIPNSENLSTLKADIRRQVQDLAEGAILLDIPNPLAWSFVLEGSDCETLAGYEPSLLRRFAAFFPDDTLTLSIRACLVFLKLPLTEPEGDEEAPQHSLDTDREDYFALALDAFERNPSSIFTHRIMSEVCLQNEDYEQTRKVSEAGLSLLGLREQELGHPFPLLRKSFTVCIAAALTYLFPPKHHLRAAGFLEDVLQIDPNHTACLMHRAFVYQWAENWADAEEAYSKVESLVGSSSDVLLEAQENRGWCIVKSGRISIGIELLKSVDAALAEVSGRELQKARTLWRLGQAYWNNSQHKEAYDNYVTALRRLNTFAPAFTALGIYYLDWVTPRDPGRASKCFQKAFELDSREGEAARRLAEGFADDREWDLVEIVASRTIAGEGGVTGGLENATGPNSKVLLPTNAWAWKAMGVVHLQRRNWTDAIQSFQVTLRADEGDFQSWLRLAEAYAHAGRHVAALKALDRADLLTPDDMGSLMIRGDIQRSLHQFGDATSTFTKAHEIRPDDTGARVALAGSLLETARMEMATGYLNRAEDSCDRAILACIALLRDASSFRAMTWKILGDAFYELSRRTSFMCSEELTFGFAAVMRIIADADPRTFLEDSYTSKAFNLLENGQINGHCSLLLAYISYRTCLVISKASTERRIGPDIDVAMVSARLKHLDPQSDDLSLNEPIDLVTQAVRTEPMNSMAWNTLGILRFGQDSGLAQHSFIMAIEVDKKNPVPWTNIGFLYLHCGDFELANHAFYRAQVLDPDYARAWVGQAMVARHNEHIVEAMALLEHSTRLSSGVPEADFECSARIFRSLPNDKPHDVERIFTAFALLDRYCHQRPDDAAALHLYGLLCERLGQIESATDLVRRSVAVLDAAYNETESAQIERQFVIAQVTLGRLRLTQSHFDEATAAAEVAIGLLPSTAEDEEAATLKTQALIIRGINSYNLDDIAGALSTLEGVPDTLPAEMKRVRGDVYLILAQILWSLGGEEAKEMAKTQLFNAVSEDSKNTDAIVGLAAIGILTDDKDVLDAALAEINATDLQQKRLLDPSSSVDRLLVSYDLSKGEYSAAVKRLTERAQLDPGNLLGQQELAKALLRQEDPSAADSTINPQISTPSDPESSHLARALTLSAVARSLAGDAVEAMRRAQRAVFLDPASSDCQKILQYCRSVYE